jgi:RNA polymerase sigma factor (sigma-70 family)
VDDSTLPTSDGPLGPSPAAALPQERDHIDLAQVEFAALYQGEKPRLVRFLIKLGAKPEDAADAAQDAFNELYKCWGPNIRKPAAWLRTVAYRKWINRVRELPLGDEEEKVNSNILPITELADLTSQQQRVIALVRKLPPNQRLVFALRYDEFTYTEIAGMLDMKEVAVRQSLARARAALKKALGQ